MSSQARDHLEKGYFDWQSPIGEFGGRKLRTGGKAIVVVPCESIRHGYGPGDRNRHFYSWSPMCIGNLLGEAGFHVLESGPYIHKWPPGYRLWAKIFGTRLFEVICRIYGHLERSWFQVRVVGERDRGHPIE